MAAPAKKPASDRGPFESAFDGPSVTVGETADSDAILLMVPRGSGVHGVPLNDDEAALLAEQLSTIIRSRVRRWARDRRAEAFHRFASVVIQRALKGQR